MSKEVLAVDMDEVFFPFVSHFIEHHNKHHGTELTHEDFKSYRFHEVLGIDFEEAVERVYAATEVEHSHVAPVAKSQESVERLTKDFDLVIVTARHPDYEVNTKNYLNSHFKGKFRDVIQIGHPDVMQIPQKKVEVCQSIGAIALIDDSPGHLEECMAEGIQGIQFGNYPWNQESEYSSGIRPREIPLCEDWPAAEEYIYARF